MLCENFNNTKEPSPCDGKIVKDYARHAGSVWKLIDSAGRRVATLWGDGSVRGK